MLNSVRSASSFSVVALLCTTVLLVLGSTSVSAQDEVENKVKSVIGEEAHSKLVDGARTLNKQLSPSKIIEALRRNLSVLAECERLQRWIREGYLLEPALSEAKELLRNKWDPCLSSGLQIADISEEILQAMQNSDLLEIVAETRADIENTVPSETKELATQKEQKTMESAGIPRVLSKEIINSELKSGRRITEIYEIDPSTARQLHTVIIEGNKPEETSVRKLLYLGLGALLVASDALPPFSAVTVAFSISFGAGLMIAALT